MVASFNKPLIRAVYVLNGVVFSLAGVGAFVLFAPRDLLPRLVARPLLDLAPWLVRGGPPNSRRCRRSCWRR